MRSPSCSRRSSIFAIAVLTIALAACDGGETSQPQAEATTARPSPSFDCTEEQQLIDNFSLGTGNALNGDVDGDGSIDVAQIILDEDGEPGCEAFLAVELADGIVSRPIWPAGATGGLPQPSIYALVDVDGRPGVEVIVNEAGGASTQFVAVYTMIDGDLEWLRLPDSETGLFAYGGSVGHLEAVDCAAGGELVVTQAVPGQGDEALEKALYDVERTTYRIEDNSLQQVSTEMDQVPIARLDSYREFRGTPFGTCSSG